MNKQRKVLVTGACGFVGSHLVEAIMKNTNWDVVTIDVLDNTTLHGFDRITDSIYYNPDRIKMLTYDLSKPLGKGMKKEIGDVEFIINLASQSHVDNSIKSPREFFNNNTNLMITILELSKELYNKGVLKKLYHFSTDEVPSTAPEGVEYSESARPNPGNVYSASKAAQEMLCRSYANTHKIPICCSRSMNIIGEKQHPEKFLPKIINKVLNGEVVKIHSENGIIGKRHYIHARNVADAALFILTKTNETLHHIDEEKGMYNIVGEAEYDNLEFAKLIASYMNKELKYEIVSMAQERPGVDLRYALSGDKLAKLGWTPKVNILDSIKKTVEWTLEEKNRKWLKE